MTSRIGRQKILVYLMPHSHDDVGWLNTVDEIYLYGPGVRNIISSYIEQLQQNPDRKFVQVETLYFERWWYEQSLTTQTKVKELVKNGQLGFAAGGLVMNDEATPYYEDIIDQMTYGHEFLFNTFGIIPTIGWQIDPFGHSNAQSVLSYLFGMDAQYFARIDYQDKQNREQHQELEMIHIPETNDEQNRKIFIHVNYQHYSSPPQMDFDTLRNNGGYVNDQNVERKANDLQNYFLKQAKFYKGDIIAHTLGDDNEWSQAKSYFENTEKIINYINSHPDKYNITIKFGTPEDYIKAINEYADEIFYPVKTDDFFPYADKQHCYWTGYFTSKIAFKGFVRYTGRQFQQMKSFISYELAKKDSQILELKQSLLTAIKDLGYALGVSQHHDAVTGTSKEAVTKDYVRILYKNLTQMNEELHKLVKLVIKRDIQQDNINEIYQYSYNATSQQCEEVYESLNQNKTVLLMLLDTKINTDEIDVIKVKVPKLTLNVIDSSNQYIKGDIICSNQRDENDCTLYFNFKIKKGIQYFKIQQSDPTNSSTTIIKEQIFTNITATTKISLDDGPEFELQYKYYVASTNNIQPSGAYIFRPEGGSTTYGQIQSAKVYNGSIVTELNIQRNNIDTWIRKYKISDFEYEIETFLDSIAREQNKGKEVLIIFKSDQIKNDKIFYTDSNGMDLQLRKLDHRETWNLQSNEQIAENYYPVNGVIQIKDMQTNLTMAIVNDRAQGGSSFSDGEIELMIHRRMYLDDRRGVGESLNEEEDNPSCTDPSRQNCLRRIGLKQQVIHKLLFFSPNTHPNAARKSQLFLDFYPLKLFAVDDEAKFKYNQVASTIETLLDQIKITNKQDTAITKLFFIPREKQNEFLVRIQNMQEVGTIDISFPDNILYEETILSGLRSWAEQQKIRLKWKKNQENEKEVEFIPDNQIGPQQIKTFMIKI